MVNLLHARVVFELLNIEHANCRIAQIASCRHAAVSPNKIRFCHFVICHLSSECVLSSTGNQHI